jgi:hypothetical protein
MAAELRQVGIAVSDVVRAAIRAAYEACVGTRAGRRRLGEIMAQIYRELPDPPGFPREGRDLRDRRSLRASIRRRLRGSS